MADKSSASKFFIGVAILGILKLVYTVVKQVIVVLAKTIVYFGLYIPFFHLIVGVVLSAFGGFEFENLTDPLTIMFYIGLALCVVASIIIFVQTYSKKPMSSITEGCGRKIREAHDKLPSKKPREDNPLYVYHSDDHPELLIEEYDDRFVVYLDDGKNPIKLLRVEPKE